MLLNHKNRNQIQRQGRNETIACPDICLVCCVPSNPVPRPPCCSRQKQRLEREGKKRRKKRRSPNNFIETVLQQSARKNPNKRAEADNRWDDGQKVQEYALRRVKRRCQNKRRADDVFMLRQARHLLSQTVDIKN